VSGIDRVEMGDEYACGVNRADQLGIGAVESDPHSLPTRVVAP
jgi:hypothetical protein